MQFFFCERRRKMKTYHIKNRFIGLICNPELLRSEERGTECFEESAATHPTTRYHAPEEWPLCFSLMNFLKKGIIKTQILKCQQDDSTLMRTFKAYCGERAWTAIRHCLRRPSCLSRVDHVGKIRDSKQSTDTGKYSFVNRTVKNWNQVPVEALGAFLCKPKIFRQRVKKAIINGVKWKE